MNDKQLPGYVLPDEEQQSKGITPLHIVISLFEMPSKIYPGEELMADVLAQTEDINARDYKGDTALHYAAGLKVRGAVEMLLEAGAEINPQNNRGRTPLWRNAWENADAEIITMLLDAGADPYILDDTGKNILEITKDSPNRESLEAFKKYFSPEEITAIEKTIEILEQI